MTKELKPRIKKVIVLEYIELPEHYKEQISEREVFHNDCILEYHNEMNTGGGDELNEKSFTDYYEDQRDTNDYTGTFEQFLEDYVVKLPYELMKMGVLTSTGTKILINICW